MSQRLNPPVWVAWAAATALLIVTTRNPLYLLIVGAALIAVHLSLDRQTAAQAAWGTVLRIGVVVASLNVLFNLLTVHSGDRVLARLPESIPIAGGPLTLNALVYGLTSALALLNLLLLAAAFSAAVDRAALLRLVPGQFASVGVAAIVALSIFPQTLRALRDVRQAQAARGFQIRSVRDLPPLVVPVLNLGLEHAFDLAEAMESRAFGAATAPTRELSRGMLVVALSTAAAGVVVFGLGYRLIAAVLALPLLATLGLMLLRGQGRRSRYRPIVWTHSDLVALGAIMLALLLVVGSVPGGALAYAPYPRLEWPPFARAPGIAGLLLIAPALAPHERHPG